MLKSLDLPSTISSPLEWGLARLGVDLAINPETYGIDDPVAIDIETDERDGFVGMAFYSGGIGPVYYTTSLWAAKTFLESNYAPKRIIGHNLKGDLKWLRKWGVTVESQNLFYDTMLASYVVNPTKESHGLKTVAKELLAYNWPSYSEIVGKGKRKKTLDKQPIETVANYCGMDCFATWRLYKHFSGSMTPNQKRILENLELPINRLLLKMELKGVQIDTLHLDELDRLYGNKLHEILEKIHTLSEKTVEHFVNGMSEIKDLKPWEKTAYTAFKETGKFNPGSWQQKKTLLTYLGLDLKTTDRKELIKYKETNELVKALLEHSETAKLFNSFITPFKALETLPVIHTTYNQVSQSKTDEEMYGIRSGRLSSSSPNLQQIPARTENGKKLRELFIPRDGMTLIVADYSQIELRLAAHFSHDPILVSAFKNGEDVHETTSKVLGVDRFWGKTANFLLAFGGSKWRLASTLNITVEKADEFVNLYWQKFSALKRWKYRTVDKARKEGGVSTLYGRWIPIKGLNDSDFKLRGAAEREAISYLIQGSAADILKLATIECDRRGYTPVLTVHDELVFEVLNEGIEAGLHEIKRVMVSVVTLDVPLEVSIGHGKNWGTAKT